MTTEHETIGGTVQYTEEEYFGVCPQCGKNDGYLNIRRAHWMVCHTHRVKWWIGENLFSTWKMETDGDWAENHAILATYAELEPLTPPSETRGGDPLPELVAYHESDRCLKVGRPIDFIKILEMREQGPVLQLGRVVATSGALAHLTLDEVKDALDRHRAGDWGNVDPADRLANDAAVREGTRVLSSYLAKDATKFWVITEADRSATTVVLPDEYSPLLRPPGNGGRFTTERRKYNAFYRKRERPAAPGPTGTGRKSLKRKSNMTTQDATPLNFGMTATSAKDSHFGGCPVCGKHDGFLNVCRTHWMVCHTHQRKWCLGSNWYHFWRDEPDEKWDRNERLIRNYAEVPFRSPEDAGPLDDVPERLFDVGGIFVTRSALLQLDINEIAHALNRHEWGDWGGEWNDVVPDDDLARRIGFPVISAYTAKGGIRLWVMTAADRSYTTVGLADDWEMLRFQPLGTHPPKLPENRLPPASSRAARLRSQPARLAKCLIQCRTR